MKNRVFKVLIFMIFLVGCTPNTEIEFYFQQLGFIENEYESVLLIIEEGCGKCRNTLYEFFKNNQSIKTALIIRRKVTEQTKTQFPDYYIFDSLDISYQLGLVKQNDEIVFITKNMEKKTFQWHEIDELISEIKFSK